MLTTEHETLLRAESGQIDAWLAHLLRLESLDPHVLCVVDLRSPIGLSVAIAATDEEHARAHLVVRLERNEVPGFSCVFEVPYQGESEAVRHITGLVNRHIEIRNGGFVGVALIHQEGAIAVGFTKLDRRSPTWGQIQWRAVLPGRSPDPAPGTNERPW